MTLRRPNPLPLWIAAPVAVCLGSLVHAQGQPVNDETTGRASVSVGDVVTPRDVHAVPQPAKFGLGPAPKDSRYAIIDDHVVRLDERSGKVLTIIRPVKPRD